MKQRYVALISLAISLVFCAGVYFYALPTFVYSDTAKSYTDDSVATSKNKFPLSDDYQTMVEKRYALLTTTGIIDKTNSYRRGLGLPELVQNEMLNRSACLKLDDMVNKNYWSHMSPDGKTPWYFIEQAGYVYENAGENLATGQTDSADVVMDWINSPTHEANLSGLYSEIGVCVKKGIKYQGIAGNSLAVAHYGIR